MLELTQIYGPQLSIALLGVFVSWTTCIRKPRGIQEAPKDTTASGKKSVLLLRSFLSLIHRIPVTWKGYLFIGLIVGATTWSVANTQEAEKERVAAIQRIEVLQSGHSDAHLAKLKIISLMTNTSARTYEQVMDFINTAYANLRFEDAHSPNPFAVSATDHSIGQKFIQDIAQALGSEATAWANTLSKIEKHHHISCSRAEHLVQGLRSISNGLEEHRANIGQRGSYDIRMVTTSLNRALRLIESLHREATALGQDVYTHTLRESMGLEP